MNKIKVIKTTDDELVIGGWGVVFGGEDLEGETFTKETDFWLDKLPGSRPVLFEHGFDKQAGMQVLGKTMTLETKDEGLWVEAQLDRHERYVQYVEELLESGALGWSSGAVGHLAQKSGQVWKSWPIAEFSLTPIPAEPRTLGVREVRSLAELYAEVKALLPQDESSEDSSADATEAEDEAVATQITVIDNDPTGEDDMGDTKKVEETKELDVQAIISLAVEEAFKKLAAEQPEKTGGYATIDEAVEDQKGTKNFGDFLLAVKRHNDGYLHDTWKTTMVEVEGQYGGYLVPEGFRAELLKLVEEASIVRPRATVIPAGGVPKTAIPALSQTGGPAAAGDPIWFGGVHLHWTEEAGAKTGTNAEFEMLNLAVHELSGYTQASNALAKDSSRAGQSIAALLQTLFAGAFAWQEDYVFLRGNGVAKPLGILNSPALLTVSRTTDSEIAYADLAEMYSKFWGQNGVWLVSRGGAVEQLLLMEDTEGHLVWQPNAVNGLPGTIFGMPVIVTEKVPTLNTEGDIGLYDFGKYIIYDMQEYAFDYSEHYAFTNNKGTWRASERIDGRPWLPSYITLTDGSTTVSPFVALTDD